MSEIHMIELICFVLLLVIISIIDLYRMIIPNTIMYAAIPAAFVLRVLDHHSLSLWNYIIAGFGAALIFYVVAVLSDGLGGGDVKLILLIGLMEGIVLTIVTILIMFIAGQIATIIVSLRRSRRSFILSGSFILMIFMGLFWIALFGWIGYLFNFSYMLLGALELIFTINLLAIIIIFGNRTGKSLIPLGPFIALGAIISLFFGNQLIIWLLHNLVRNV